MQTKKKFKKCIIHIGLEKTGTSTVQQFLVLNRRKLYRDKILYPRTIGSVGGSQWELVAAVHDQPWQFDFGDEFNIQSKQDQDNFCQHLLAKLAKEFEQSSSAETLILSSEHFHSRLNNIGMIHRLKDLLSPWVESFEIILYLRRQDRVAVSLYSTQIKSGNQAPHIFPTMANGHLHYYFDYEKIVSNWSEIFGEKTIRAKIFQFKGMESQKLIEDFCFTCDIPHENKKIPSMINQSLSGKNLALLLAVNKQMPVFRHGKRNEERVALLQAINAVDQEASYPATRTDAQNFYDHFNEGNERLKSRLFPERVTPLFDNDFSAYPEHNAFSDLSYDDAVETALQLWRYERRQNTFVNYIFSVLRKFKNWFLHRRR